MAARNLHEIARTTILTEIQAKIDAALAELRAARPDDEVTTESFQTFFINPEQQAWDLPALYLIAGDIDKQKAKGANHINAGLVLDVICVVEARDTRLLELKVERYMCALDKILDHTPLLSANSDLKLFIIVQTLRKSPPFQNTRDEGAFRKEGIITCNVQFSENF